MLTGKSITITLSKCEEKEGGVSDSEIKTDMDTRLAGTDLKEC